jgi:hypothetical protein
MSAFSPTFCFIRNKLQEDNTMVECSDREVDAIMELLEVCLKTTFKLINSTKGGYGYGELSVVVSNIFMEHSEKLALDMVEHNHCGIYVDDTFVI